MDSLLASYASSDEEEQEVPEQPEDMDAPAKPPKISSIFSYLPPPKSQPTLSSSLPRPKSELPNPPQTLTNLSSSKPSNQLQQKEQNQPSSVFSSLPPPKSRNTDPLALPNLSSSSNPNRRRVVQVNIPINPSLMKFRNFDDDDDEKEREGKKSVESSIQTTSVKSFLSSIPAPKNSSALGALSTASGSGRRSIIESDVTTSNTNSFETEAEVSANPTVHNYDGQLADGASSASLGDVGASAEYAVGGGSGGGGDSSAWVASGANYEYFDNSAGYGNYDCYGQNESNWDSAATTMTPLDTSAMVESVMKVPGKRGRSEVPREIVEVNQDELIKNRPREDQARLTGIAFGPSYQPVSTKGKPSKLHKRKHQIGTLFFDMKQKEMELSERRAKGFLTKAETQAKYGW